MAYTWNTIFLGNIATMIDPTEGNSVSENAGLLVGSTYGSELDPLAKNIVQMTTNYAGGDPTVLDSDNWSSSDQLLFDLGEGAGPQSTTMDGIVEYAATLTYMDGTTTTVTAVLVQDDLGNLFLMPELTANADTAAYEASGIRSLTLDTLNQDTANLDPNRYEAAFICFARGTLIATPEGQRPVESIEEGDTVTTLDHGVQRVRWAGRLGEIGKAPSAIRIAGGALGPGLPARDLTVTRQHRLVLRSRIVERMFKKPEVLVCAKHLAGLPGITAQIPTLGMTFHHLMFERHEVLLAEGAAVESLLLAQMSLDTLAAPDRIRCLTRHMAGCAAMIPARLIPEGRRQKRLAERHRKNPHLALFDGLPIHASPPLVLIRAS